MNWVLTPKCWVASSFLRATRLFLKEMMGKVSWQTLPDAFAFLSLCLKRKKEKKPTFSHRSIQYLYRLSDFDAGDNIDQWWTSAVAEVDTYPIHSHETRSTAPRELVPALQNSRLAGGACLLIFRISSNALNMSFRILLSFIPLPSPSSYYLSFCDFSLCLVSLDI